MRKTVDDQIAYLNLLEEFSFPQDAVLFVSSDVGVFARNIQKGNERFQADLFIDKLQELVPEGTVIIPGYTDHLFDGDTFDRDKTKPNVGALPNKTMRRTDFVRTSDPLHSVFAWGMDSERLLDCDDESTFGPNSMFAYLHEKDVYFIFIDIHIQECFTYIHYVEECKQVKYRRYYDFTVKQIENGVEKERKTRFYSKKLGVISDIRRLHDIFEREDDYTSLFYRGSRIDVLKSKTVFEKASRCIEEGPALYTFSLKKWVKDFVKRHILKQKGIL